jgi:hypothetical protein
MRSMSVLLCTTLALTACALGDPTQTGAPRQSQTPAKVLSEEMTYLKAKPGARDQLTKFIEANWFAMDKIAVVRGLMTDYELLFNQADGDWDMAVRVRYPHAGGYATISQEFDAIRRAHQTVRIDGKTLADLGSIVRSEKLPR